MKKIKINLDFVLTYAVYSFEDYDLDNYRPVGFLDCFKNPDHYRQIAVNRTRVERSAVAFISEEEGLKFLVLDEHKKGKPSKKPFEVNLFCPDGIKAEIMWSGNPFRSPDTKDAVVTIDASLKIFFKNIPTELYGFTWGLICSFAMGKMTTRQILDYLEKEVTSYCDKLIEKADKAVAIAKAEIKKAECVRSNLPLMSVQMFTY